jgi:hypothetical protein
MLTSTIIIDGCGYPMKWLAKGSRNELTFPDKSKPLALSLSRGRDARVLTGCRRGLDAKVDGAHKRNELAHLR